MIKRVMLLNARKNKDKLFSTSPDHTALSRGVYLGVIVPPSTYKTGNVYGEITELVSYFEVIRDKLRGMKNGLELVEHEINRSYEKQKAKEKDWAKEKEQLWKSSFTGGGKHGDTSVSGIIERHDTNKRIEYLEKYIENLKLKEVRETFMNFEDRLKPLLDTYDEIIAAVEKQMDDEASTKNIVLREICERIISEKLEEITKIKTEVESVFTQNGDFGDFERILTNNYGFEMKTANDTEIKDLFTLLNRSYAREAGKADLVRHTTD